jgi:hypothetical protein
MKKGIVVFLIIAVFFLLQFTSPSFAEQAYLSNIVLTDTSDHLLVYFSVEDCFTPEMNKAIDSGLNTTFTFFVTLYEKNFFWWDKKIINDKISHSIKYDHLKKNYEVRLSDKKSEAITVNDFEKAKKLMTEVVAYKVIPLAGLKKGSRYQLQLMAELDKIRLPLYLHYVFFFLSLWDFKTDWYTINFSYS